MRTSGRVEHQANRVLRLVRRPAPMPFETDGRTKAVNTFVQMEGTYRLGGEGDLRWPMAAAPKLSR
jgi:hypothetical protein